MTKLYIITLLLLSFYLLNVSSKGTCKCDMNDGSIIKLDSPNYEVCQERCNVIASKQVIECDTKTCTCNCPNKQRPCISKPSHVSSSSTHSSTGGEESGNSFGSGCSGSGCSSTGSISASGSGSGSGSGIILINEKIRSSSTCKYSHCPCTKQVINITFK